MPRTLDPVLEQALRRANPATCDIVEISAPDATRILRRANDQFLTPTPTGPRVSETPLGSSNVDANGALILHPTNTQIANFPIENSAVLFGATVDPSTIIKGVGWTMPMTMGRVALKRFTARIHRLAIQPTIDLELRIYRPKIQRYYYRNPVTSAIEEQRGVTFLDVLPEPVIVRYSTITWGGTGSFFADWIFDLSHIRPELSPGPLFDDPILNDPDALNPHYIFQINPVNPPRGNLLEWMVDQTTPINVANYGTFQEIAWTRPANRTNDPLAWSVAKQNYCECFRLEIETYAPTSTIVYAVDVGKVPDPASTGRVVFERGVPTGGAATLELSTAGSGGPWTPVKHGDEVTTKQQTYHLRLGMTAPAGSRHTPRVRALGLDFRVVKDVSAEVLLDPVVHEIQLPYCQSAIGEGSATVVRHGRRDYRDVASDLAVTYPVSKLELDHYIGSRLSKIGRHTWLHCDRVAVTNRDPSESAERFGLLSPLKALKKKIPARIETISTVHMVTSATTGQVVVTPQLQGASGTGSYLGRGYYMRVRASSQIGTPPGYIQTIDNNTNLDTLNFSTALPGTLVAGDFVEVHSGEFEQPSLEWVDADPADIWWELLTVHLLIPAERIGFGGIGQVARSGLPPRVADRAPGDATTQAKLKVTLRLQEAQDADKLLDQISFILGGCTVEIGGQFVFRQIYPLRNAAGDITVPTSTPEIVFDARDYAGLQAPTGLEQRINTLACDYGVNTTILPDSAQPTQTVVFADGDAIAYLAEQDVEGLGNAAIAKEIARWCYNSADGGRFLAEQLTRQVVNYGSTGLRVWSWTSVDARPELVIGDSVWIVTDQYTDYDPTRKLAIRGPWAFQLIVTHVSGGGRRFRGLMPGLGAATQIRGGPGTLTGDSSAIGPTLDVNATPGATQFTIHYTVEATVFEYSVDGGVFGIVPPTGFTVTRPAAGAADRTLTFRATKNFQTVTNTITVPAVDKDTVAPDLSVVQTAQSPTQSTFQATTSNPGGGAAPTLQFTLVNTTAVGYVGAGPHTIASGTSVVVNRPTYGAGQATVRFRAAISGGGVEEISRTIPNIESTGPALDVRATPGASSFTITYTVTATTFEYSIDGAAYIGVPASGFSVTRPAAGANDRTLTFRAVKDGQTVTNTVIVPAVDKDTVTPDLAVTQTAQDETTTSFQASATNPAGGAAPTITFTLVNTTASGYVGAGPHTIASGTTVVVNRPTLSANQATIKFRATIAGSGAEEISRTIPNTAYDPGTDVENMVVNGGGQSGAPGAQAPGWSYFTGNGLNVSTNAARFGDRSLTIGNPAPTDSFSYQDFSVTDGAFYELSGWIAGDLVASISPTMELVHMSGGALDVFDHVAPVFDAVSNAFAVGPGTGTYDFFFVRALFRVTGSGSLRVHCRLGGLPAVVVPTSGTAFFDGISLKRVTRLAPHLRVWAVEGSTSYTIFYEVDSDSTLVYRTDNGSDSTPPASGFTVSRNAFGGAAKVLTFTATRAGQTKVVSIGVPPQADPAAGITANVDALFWVSTDYTDDEITMRFNWSGAIGSGAFRMYRIVSAGTAPDMSGTQTLIYNSNGASPVTVIDAPSAGDIQSTTGPKKTFSYQVRVVDVDGNVLRSSEWVHRSETVV